MTTAPIDAAQSFLASAVTAAANSRPWSLPDSPSSPSPSSTWPASETAAAAPPPPPPPPNMQHGGPLGLATMMAAAQAAGAPPAFETVVGGVQVAAPAVATAAGAAAAAAAAATAAAGAPAAAAPAAGMGLPAMPLFAAGNVQRIGQKSVLIHYEGYKSRYDEWIAVQSPRLAPFRSRTSRPLSVTMQSVERVVNGASVRCVGCGGKMSRRVNWGGGGGCPWSDEGRRGCFFLSPSVPSLLSLRGSHRALAHCADRRRFFRGYRGLSRVSTALVL